jgi:isopenicillin N synthase-like dioxygenase
MPSLVSSSFYLPTVDITPFLEDPTSTAAQQVVEDLRTACISTGFFQMTGHGVPTSLQQSVFDAAAKFFKLPQPVKTKLDARSNCGFRGYDVMGTQLYEDDVLPDLKEGFFLGQDISAEDPRVAARRFFMGPNVWPPTGMLASQDFRDPLEKYYHAMSDLSHIVLDLLAATLPYGPHVFDEFKVNDPACPMRLPALSPDSSGGHHRGGRSAEEAAGKQCSH